MGDVSWFGGDHDGSMARAAVKECCSKVRTMLKRSAKRSKQAVKPSRRLPSGRTVPEALGLWRNCMKDLVRELEEKDPTTTDALIGTICAIGKKHCQKIQLMDETRKRELRESE